MELDITVGGPKVTRLGLLKVGIDGIFRFVDSADHPEDCYAALQEPGSNLFMPFKPADKKWSKNGVCAVSLDGKQILCRPEGRMVQRVVIGERSLEWELDRAKSRVSNVDPGKIAIIHPDTVKADQERSFMFLVACKDPSISNKIIMIDFSGNQVFVDDDLLVRVGVAKFSVALKYA